MTEKEQLEKGISALESQRSILGDAVVDASIAAIKAQLTALEPAPSQPQQQRKQVTVLFADVSGFTAMSERMDAEDVNEVMNALWERVDGAILEYNGRIDKHIGDAVMALWGGDKAREDDPEQAIRGALAMQEAIRAFAEENDISLKMRIGINTGPVLLGEVGTTSEFTAMGDTVNTASRLEHAAPIGEILISHNTYQHVRGVFDVEVQEPISVKGKIGPLEIYVVNRVKPRAFRMGRRGIEGIETETIGREEELKVLQEAYETAVRERKTTVVTIVGDAGVGKSRLLYEFNNWIELRPELLCLFRGHALQQTEGVPQYIVRDILGDYFQILDSDSHQVVQEKFVNGFTTILPDDGEMKALILGSWLGYNFSKSIYLQSVQNDPEQIKNRATHYLTQFLTTIGNKQPILIFLEDAHWADSGSLATFIDLTRRRPQLPLLIVCLTRPSLYERQPRWGEKVPFHTRLDLVPLSAENSQALIMELLRLVNPLPQVLLDLVSNRAEGNPFYAEELVKMLIDNGVLVTGASTWHVVPENLLKLSVPATLTGVLQARLDRLESREKQVAQQASVVGRIFWDQALFELNTEVYKALTALETKGFIFSRQVSTFADTQEYIFKHALLRDVAYESVLKRVRRGYHAQIAAWLVSTAKANGRSNEFAAQIGEHYQLAEDLTSASSWYGRAGYQATKIFAHEEAIRYLTLALQSIPKNEHVTRFGILESREKAYDMQGEREEQANDLEQLAILAGHLGVIEQATIALRQANYAHVTSDYGQAIIYARAAIEWGKIGGDMHLVSEGHWAWGRALGQQGKYELAQKQLRAGLQFAQEINDQKQVASCLLVLGFVATNQKEFASAQKHHELSLTIFRAIGDQWGEGMCLGNLGFVASSQGDYALAKQYYEQALLIRQKIGDRLGEGLSLNSLGRIASIQGDDALAKEYYKLALTIRQEIGDRNGEAGSLNNLGWVAKKQGDYATAGEHFHQSLTIQQEISDRFGECVSLINLGYIALNQGNDALAQSRCKQALIISREIGNRLLEGESLYILGIVALSQANPSLAENYYKSALILHKELNQPQYVVEVWAGLAIVHLAQDNLESARKYGQRILDYLDENPSLNGVENPMRTFAFTWEALNALNQSSNAIHVLTLAANVIQDYLDKNDDPELQAMYLAQPHHKVLWAAWQEQHKTD